MRHLTTIAACRGVKVSLSGPNAFQFTVYPGAAPKVTHVFEGAKIKGKVNKPAIDAHNRVTIRLQGIDAPELHYRPQARTLHGVKPTPQQRADFNAANGNFRQKFGETSTLALGNFLTKAGTGPIPCVVRTSVDLPNDVFDTFGRFVGDIFVTLGGKERNVNHWLCQNGWAFPTFYTSMGRIEINDLTALSDAARKAKAGIWKRATSNLSGFDTTLVFRNHGAPDPASDDGPVYLPKLFRRRATFGVAKQAKIASGTFKSYLTAVPDRCVETKDFLAQGAAAATSQSLDQFVTPASRFTVGAADLVFQEMKSEVVDKNGVPVKTW